ncbi:MAG TPA: Na-translocating system protein MpsC family protein [Thermoleophilaceae bacterium]|nr:Na-translocating system protein MpsC family protein [Thermoleophilaceae bacterium]
MLTHDETIAPSRPPQAPSAEAARSGAGDRERLGLELQEVTNAMVRIYKHLFGRGPTKARSAYAGPDTLIATLEDSLTPAERNLIARGQRQQVGEIRGLFQAASERDFIETVERITGRKVRAFVSGTDTTQDVSAEIFYLEPLAE